MRFAQHRKAALIAGAVVATLLVAYAAAGYLLAPSLVRNALVERARQAGVDLRIGSLATDPFRLAVHGDDVQVLVKGRPLARAPRASVDLSWASLWRRDWVIDRVTLSDGTLTLTGAPRLEHLELDGTGERFRASAAVGSGQVASEGTFSLSPPGVSGSLQVTAAPLQEAWRYLPDSFGKAPPGRIDGSLQYRYAEAHLALSQASAQARLDSGGSLALRGNVALAPFAADLRLEAGAVPVALARPLLKESALRVASGTLS